MNDAIERLLMPWHFVDQTMQFMLAPDTDLREWRVRDMRGNLASKVYKLSTHCYFVYSNEGALLALGTKYTSLEQAKEACDIRLKELGFEFISEERSKRIELLL